MKKLAFVSVLAAAPLACSADETTNADGGGSEGTGAGGSSTGGGGDGGTAAADGGTSAGPNGDDSGSAEDGKADGGSEDDGGGDDAPPTEPPPATGIQIVDVTADQGIMIPIAVEGSLVDGPQRNSPILQGRDTLIRAFYELDEGWERRDIQATLYVEQTDGTVSEYVSFIDVYPRDCDAGVSRIECNYSTLPTSFFWKVEAQDMLPGATYRIEMVETAPGHEDDVSDKVPVFPTSGETLPIGIEDSYMKMRVVLVPFDHDLGAECPEPPDLVEVLGQDPDGSDRTPAKVFQERLLAHNPADEVEIIVHDVVRYTGSLQGSQLLSTLQQLRFQEDAPPEYYYYGVARPCDGGPDFAGVAQIGGPTPGQASSRVGWGVWYNSLSTTAETFVHEIGHEQGRYHVACNGQEGGPDPSYPDHPEGDTEGFGTDLFGPQVKVHNKGAHDYMTYCTSTWVSEWGWLYVYPRIETISSWELQGAPGTKEPLLVGNVRADGSEQWYVTVGYPPEPQGAGERIRLTIEGAAIEERDATVVQWERSDDYNIIAPLRAELDAVTDLSWVSNGEARAIDRASIQVVGPMNLTSR